VSTITSTITQLRTYNAEKMKQEHNLRQFLSHNKLSPELVNRAWAFIRSSSSVRKERMPEKKVRLLQELPQSLLIEVHAEVYAPMLTKHPFFHFLGGFSVSLIYKICHTAFTQRTTLANHELFLRGHVCSHMYFVSSGTFKYSVHEVQDNENRVKRTATMDSFQEGVVSEGNWICEAALWMKWVTCGSLVALSHCEVFELEDQAFNVLVATVPATKIYGELFMQEVKKRGKRAPDCWDGVDDRFWDQDRLKEMANEAFPEQADQERRMSKKRVNRSKSGSGLLHHLLKMGSARHITDFFVP